jgi:hypothetical protein
MKSVPGLNILLENHLDVLDRRVGFKISVFRLSVYPIWNFNA